MSQPKRGVGRPPVGRDPQRVSVTLDADDLAAVDAWSWCRGIPRTEAIREMLRFAASGSAGQVERPPDRVVVWKRAEKHGPRTPFPLPDEAALRDRDPD